MTEHTDAKPPLPPNVRPCCLQTITLLEGLRDRSNDAS